MEKITVLLVDDHPVVREGLRASVARDPLLEVVGEAGDGIEALQLVGELNPDVVVMDVSLPSLDGIQATMEIRAAHPETAVVILSIYDQDGYVRRARQAGASGYLTKDVPSALICHTIKAVHRGEAPARLPPEPLPPPDRHKRAGYVPSVRGSAFPARLPSDGPGAGGAEAAHGGVDQPGHSRGAWYIPGHRQEARPEHHRQAQRLR